MRVYEGLLRFISEGLLGFRVNEGLLGFRVCEG